MRGRQRYDFTDSDSKMRTGKNLSPAWKTPEVAKYFGINLKSLYGALASDPNAPTPTSVLCNGRGRVYHLWDEAARSRLAAWWVSRQEAKA